MPSKRVKSLYHKGVEKSIGSALNPEAGSTSSNFQFQEKHPVKIKQQEQETESEVA
jgi:hypothetical protein